MAQGISNGHNREERDWGEHRLAYRTVHVAKDCVLFPRWQKHGVKAVLLLSLLLYADNQSFLFTVCVPPTHPQKQHQSRMALQTMKESSLA